MHSAARPKASAPRMNSASSRSKPRREGAATANVIKGTPTTTNVETRGTRAAGDAISPKRAPSIITDVNKHRSRPQEKPAVGSGPVGGAETRIADLIKSRRG